MNIETRKLLGRLQAGRVLVDEDWARVLADPGLTGPALAIVLHGYAKQACLEHGVRVHHVEIRKAMVPLLSREQPVAWVEVSHDGQGHVVVLALIGRAPMGGVMVTPGGFTFGGF